MAVTGRLRRASCPRSATLAASIAASIAGGLASGAAAAAAPGEPELGAAAIALPGARAFASGLELACFDTPGSELNLQLRLTQLDPVLVQLGLAPHDATVRELLQTCMPVQKNGVSPGPAALPFLQHADLACYRIDASPLASAVPLSLLHHNPVLATLPAHTAALIQPVQLCVAVAKAGDVVAPEVTRLLRFIALECYAADPGAQPTFAVGLRHLDPELASLGGHRATLVPSPRQVCVPVQTNQQAIPADVLGIVRWIELERYTVAPVVLGPPVPAVLGHVHPLLTTLPRIEVVLRETSAVMASVAQRGEPLPPP